MMYYYRTCLDCSRIQIRKPGKVEWSKWYKASQVLEAARKDHDILESDGRVVCPVCKGKLSCKKRFAARA